MNHDYRQNHASADDRRANPLSTAACCCLLTLLAIPAAHAGPLSDITRREAPPPPPPLETKDVKDDDAVELPSVTVKSRRQKEQETIEQKLRKATQPKPKAEADLNKASQEQKDLASFQSDPDGYKNLPGDHSREFLAPVGDQTGGCGADITKGCKPRP